MTSLIPYFPTTLYEHFMYLTVGVGIILLVYAIFTEQEHRQDLIRAIGGSCLFVYAASIQNLFFMIAFGAIVIASLVEFFEILFGLHKHSKEDLKKYKTLWRLK